MTMPSSAEPPLGGRIRAAGDERVADLARRVRERRRVPNSTYRLQFHEGFGFDAARAIVPYLARLGVGDCYSSPYLKARPGSLHGYDICDHNEMNPEMGDAAAYDGFVATLRAHSMGQVLDFVPNHMGIDPDTNRWWRDVLENGSASPFASYFDIDWDPITPELEGKVLLPILADQYGKVLERGELRLKFDDGGLVLEVAGRTLPISPRQSPQVYRLGLEELGNEMRGSPESEAEIREFLSILTALRNLPARVESTPEAIVDRQREKEVARDRLRKLVETSPRIRRHVDDAVRRFNGEPGNRESFDMLHDLLEAQAYRLAYWRTASHEINYRRFFEVNDLGCLRMEVPEVFEATHRLVLRWLAEGKVDALRIDHVDGLFDPARYLEMLQLAVARSWSADSSDFEASTDDELRAALARLRDERGERGLRSGASWLVVEKILSDGESVPEAWPVDGTTGYDYLNLANGLFVEARNARAMRQLYERFTGMKTGFAQVVYESKRLILSSTLASELNMLATSLSRLAERDRRSRDFTLDSLRDALREFVACLPTYRTYVGESGGGEHDHKTIDSALAWATYRNPTMEPSIFGFIRDVLLPGEDGITPDERAERLRFAMKLQQYSGPVQAKGLEDTAFYRFVLLVSLNEVGGDPRRFGVSPSRFHEENRRRIEECPRAMLATSTHDTKRGEDARARIDVLSELPEQWRRCVFRWARLNAAHRTKLGDEWAPDRNDEYLFYQTLLGFWPIAAAASEQDGLVDRMRDYMLKAIREAKRHTSWINENQSYEQGVVRFVERTLKGRGSARFFESFLPFLRTVARAGMVNSLAQVVLKIASPGTPDFYQGTEVWSHALVDPDNRRPVDYAARERLLAGLEPLFDPARQAAGETAAAVDGMLTGWEDGRIKMWVTAAGLRLRRRSRALTSGDYRPIDVVGDQADRVVAFARCAGDECVAAVVPVRTAALAPSDRGLPVGREVWAATRLALPDDLRGKRWRNALTGETGAGGEEISMGDVLAHCPVALLEAL
jgi:(1->4)-alpha-D-glucan 1-alpha-D-glucosylmutase